MKKNLLSIFVPLLMSFNLSAENLCPAYEPVIDGCTFPSEIEKVLPSLSFFYKDLWSSQCNQHDINYQVLGKSKSDSDEKLYSDMKNRCDSKINKFLSPSLNAQCKSIASGVREVLRNVPEKDYYLPNQNNIANFYKNTAGNVDNNFCKTTVEKAGFIDSNLLSSINQIFNTQAGRSPTAYERMRLVALYSPYQTKQVYFDDVNYYSRLFGQNSGPTARYSRVLGEVNVFKLNASTSIGSGLSYRWDLNYGSSNSSIFQEWFSPLYNETYYISGVLEVTDRNGNADFVIVDEKMFVRGECAPTPDFECF